MKDRNLKNFHLNDSKLKIYFRGKGNQITEASVNTGKTIVEKSKIVFKYKLLIACSFFIIERERILALKAEDSPQNYFRFPFFLLLFYAEI